MAKANRELLHRAQRADGHSPAAVLALGSSLAALSAQVSGLFELNRFLDEAVLEELLNERRSLADDLDLLESLVAGSPGSPDIEPLATAVRRRIEQLLEREARGFYEPLLRSATRRQTEARQSLSEEVSP